MYQKRGALCQKRGDLCQKRGILCQKRGDLCQKRGILPRFTVRQTAARAFGLHLCCWCNGIHGTEEHQFCIKSDEYCIKSDEFCI